MRVHLPTILSGISLGLAVAVSWWIALWPSFYQGMAAIVPLQGEEPREMTKLTLSFIQVNGIWGAFILLIPVFIALGGLLVSLQKCYQHNYFKTALWVLSVLFLLFCALGVFSIGTFYLPSALALLVAAIFRQKSTLENQA